MRQHSKGRHSISRSWLGELEGQASKHRAKSFLNVALNNHVMLHSKLLEVSCWFVRLPFAPMSFSGAVIEGFEDKKYEKLDGTGWHRS